MRTAIAAASLGVLASSAWADDVFPPAWRGDPHSIVAAWDFWGLEGAGPRIIQPGFYQAKPDVLPDPKAISYIDSEVLVHNSLFGRQSVVEVGYRDLPGELAFGMANYDGFDQLLVRFQITYWPDGGAPMRFGLGAISGDPPWVFPDSVAAVVTDAFMHPDGWRIAVYDLLIEPSSGFGGVGIMEWTDLPAYVDQVWIDTLAVPEPGIVAAFVLAAIIVARRRR